MPKIVWAIIHHSQHGNDMEAVEKTFAQTAAPVQTNPRRLRPRSIWTYAYAIAISLILLIGWQGRGDSYLSPTDGLGYALGITGGSLMLLLLLYPLRKRLRLMQGWGPVKYWFQMHMLLGILGPVLVIFHSNFQLGSTNSNLALVSMLIVAGSGIIGRFLYTKIHFGLYGHKATLKELRHEIQISKGRLGGKISLSPGILKRIKRHEKFMIRPRSFIVHFLVLPYMYLYSKISRNHIKNILIRDLKKQAVKHHWERDMLVDFVKDARWYLRNYFDCLNKVSHLSLYARLFSLWHVLHLPLFIMLVITGIIHVIAVHMY